MLHVHPSDEHEHLFQTIWDRFEKGHITLYDARAALRIGYKYCKPRISGTGPGTDPGTSKPWQLTLP